MDVHRIIPLKAFAIEEQPGDMTRYTHIITVDEYDVYVTKDLGRFGAGCEISFRISDLEAYVKNNMMLLNIKQQANWAKELNADYNPWTLASAIRCAIKVLELGKGEKNASI